MIFWSIFLPVLAFTLVIYFTYWPALHKRGPGRQYKIDVVHSVRILRSEYRLTCLSLVIFFLVGLLNGFMIDHGMTRVRPAGPLTLSSFLIGLGGFLCAALLHDFYFYTTHRLLHSRLMFGTVHKIHHHSHDTNAWSAFSFHPVEGIIQVGIIPIVGLLIPMTETALILFATYLLLMTVYGHSGYELRSHRLKMFAFFNTSYHHFMHHRYVDCNYGIYLNVWDRLFGTNHREYEKSLDELAERISAPPENS
jgi:lathosterol oxidase